MNDAISVIVPEYTWQEHFLGYETDIICPKGITADQIIVQEVHNRRKTSPALESLIQGKWDEILKKHPNAFNGKRARYEGSFFVQGYLVLQWSHEQYKTHAGINDTGLPRPYQANILGINGIPLTEDNKIPIVTRNPKTTNQGRIRHIVPAGMVDIIMGSRQKPCIETLHAATEREFREELNSCADGTAAFNPENMKLLGIVYNSFKNFDYVGAILVPLKTSSGNITLKGDEHEQMEWVSAELKELKELLLELSSAPETNSGHLRGNIALLIGHLYGKDAYTETIDETIMKLKKYC